MTTLRMLAWKGYSDIIGSFTAELEDEGLKVIVYEQDNADMIYSMFSAGREFYDIVIVDWEYRQFYRNMTHPLPPNILKFSKYLEPFRKRYFAEVGDDLYFLPLRFGTNGVIYRADRGAVRPLTDVLRGRTDGLRVGVWDWWLPNLLLLARHAGYKSLDGLTRNDLAQLEHGVVATFADSVRAMDHQHKSLFHGLSDVIDNELSRQSETRKVDWMLGPSEMIVAPISNAQAIRGTPSTLDWSIDAGGLVWLEMAALSHRLSEREEQLDGALRLLRFLQSEDVQIALMCGSRRPEDEAYRGHWAYALNNINGIERVPSTVRSAFHNEAFAKSAERFGHWVEHHLNQGLLLMRVLPQQPMSWATVWRNALVRMDW